MAATKVQANWSSVDIASQAITRVTDVKFSFGGQLTGFSGDTDKFNTVYANLMNDVTCTITTADAGTAMGQKGSTGTVTATHNDILGATGGAINYTLANAIVENVDTSGSHAAAGTAGISIKSTSSDGTTNPLTFTRS